MPLPPTDPAAIHLSFTTHSATPTLDAPSILASEGASALPTLDLGDTQLLLGQMHAATPQTPTGTFDAGVVTTDVITAYAPAHANHFVINPTFDASVTNDLAIVSNYESAVASAITFFENNITTPITVNINFGWGEIGGVAGTTGATINPNDVGQSEWSTWNFPYSQIQSKLAGLPNQSAVQQAAYATLGTADPTQGATIELTTAQANALDLLGGPGGGSVGLNNTKPFFWSQSQAASWSFDAVGVLEHEISEVLGRYDNIGNGGTYTILDFFRYTAQGNNTAATAGTPVGTPDTPDQPFANGYSAGNQAYFSWNGQTITQSYDTPDDISAGYDAADWGPSVTGDPFGFAYEGMVSPISATDLQELNVIGYSLAAACYAEGTRILTARGPIAIEDLAVGELVPTVSGRLARIAWLGHRSVEPTRHPEPHTMNPIRVHAGAFGNAPTHDLLLSPDHAVLLDGALVPIRHLANGTSIAQEQHRRITYWHVELDRHDAILAEGLACETYLDTGNRGAFEGNATTQLHPDFRQHHAEAIWAARGCAPILTDPANPALRRLHTRTLARAA